MAKRWTKREEQALLQGIGVYGVSWFQRRCGDAYSWPNALPGRSVNAVYSKIRRMYGQGGLSRGSYTVTQIIRSTKYSKSQIQRAMRALGQKWKRLSATGAYLIHEDQYEDLIAWLANDYWSKKHRLYNCLWCQGHTREHSCRGLCTQCYRRYAKQLERRQLPNSTSALLALVRAQLIDVDIDARKKIERQLSRGRALPESVVPLLTGVPC